MTRVNFKSDGLKNSVLSAPINKTPENDPKDKQQMKKHLFIKI
jgi:hypothetical protein